MSYRYRSADGLACSNDPALIATWNGLAANEAKRTRAWVADLRALGVKAAHPDDGWVNRKADTVQLVYPQFNDGPGVGDLIALGDPERYRLVRVIACREVGIVARSMCYWFAELTK